MNPADVLMDILSGKGLRPADAGPVPTPQELANMWQEHSNELWNFDNDVCDDDQVSIPGNADYSIDEKLNRYEQDRQDTAYALPTHMVRTPPLAADTTSHQLRRSFDSTRMSTHHRSSTHPSRAMTPVLGESYDSDQNQQPISRDDMTRALNALGGLSQFPEPKRTLSNSSYATARGHRVAFSQPQTAGFASDKKAIEPLDSMRTKSSHCTSYVSALDLPEFTYTGVDEAFQPYSQTNNDQKTNDVLQIPFLETQVNHLYDGAIANTTPLFNNTKQKYDQTSLTIPNPPSGRKGSVSSCPAFIPTTNEYLKKEIRREVKHRALESAATHKRIKRQARARGAPILRQLYLAHNRSILQQYRRVNAFLLEVAVSALTGLLMGSAVMAYDGALYQGLLIEPFTLISPSSVEVAVPMLAMIVGCATGLAGGNK